MLLGTTATIDDLRAMRDAGLDDAILARAELGTSVLGICGGFQMLGETILDEHGVEAAAGTQVQGLGLLPQTTTFFRTKETQRSRGAVEARVYGPRRSGSRSAGTRFIWGARSG